MHHVSVCWDNLGFLIIAAFITVDLLWKSSPILCTPTSFVGPHLILDVNIFYSFPFYQFDWSVQRKLVFISFFFSTVFLVSTLYISALRPISLFFAWFGFISLFSRFLRWGLWELIWYFSAFLVYEFGVVNLSLSAWFTVFDIVCVLYFLVHLVQCILNSSEISFLLTRS